MAQTNIAPTTTPIIGDYKILARIGKGGLAEVYKALQMSLQREVAIKILSAQYTLDSEIVKRFERESLLIAKLNHPNIVHVIDKGIKGHRYYFVMEYVDGANLKQIIYDPDVDIKNKIEIIIQVCKALDFAHKNGVVHRDIKPANILIDRQGNAKVADFGIAQLHDNADCEQTSGDLVMGTLAYMSPEQKLSSASVTKATDIYALGVILYEACCGKRPEGRYPLPSEINPYLPPAMDDIVTRCLAENPGDRFPTAGALKDALLNAFAGEIYNSQPAESAIANVESFMGRCRFLDTLKETSYGSTYLVENKEAGTLYIIKKSNQGDAGLKEAKVLARYKHDNIINILGAGGDGKKTVIVTEYAPRGSLADRMVKSYTWKEAMAIIIQMAEGLEFAHSNNIIHGNLRPSNVLFHEDEVVKLTDFGLPAHYTMHKDWFAPPERKQSKQGDIFSLGAVAYMLMTNKIPQHSSSGAPYFADIELKVPKPILNTLSRMLMVRAAKRYQSVREILDDYTDYLASLEEPPVRPVSPAPSPKKNHSTMPAILFAAAVAVGVVLALFWDKLFG
jgi:serine/threonine protein kinase